MKKFATVLLFLLLATTVLAENLIKTVDQYRLACNNAMKEFQDARQQYYDFFHDCYQRYDNNSFGYIQAQLCTKSQWREAYEKFKPKVEAANLACLRYIDILKQSLAKANQGKQIYCGDSSKADSTKCREYTVAAFTLNNQLTYNKNYEDSDYNGYTDELDYATNSHGECLYMVDNCSYIFADDTHALTIYQPPSTVKRVADGDVYLTVEVGTSGKVRDIDVSITQGKKLLGMGMLQKGGKGWYHQFIIPAYKVEDGQIEVDIVATLESGTITKKLYVNVVPQNATISESGNTNQGGPATNGQGQTAAGNNGQSSTNGGQSSQGSGQGSQQGNGGIQSQGTAGSKQSSGTGVNSQNGKSAKTPAERKKRIDDEMAASGCTHCSKSIFDGVRASAVTSESTNTKKRIEDIAKKRKFKISFVSTPYGDMPVLEKPTPNGDNKSLLTYQQKKKVLNVSKSFLGKVFDGLKNALGLSFGDKALGYFANKELENAVYNDDDKVEKTKEELGVDGHRAKLFNDVVDTNNRDLYKAVSEEVPDNEVTKKAKEALTALEHFHDRAAASGLAFEYKTVEDTVKGYVKGMSPEKLKNMKDALRNLAAQNVEDYIGSTYQNGNGLVSNGRFINTIAKGNNGKYNFKNPGDRAKYFFDLLWDSGKIQEWAQQK